MYSNSSEHLTSNPPVEVSQHPKPPRLILEGIFAFPPNRDTLGGTAYFIVEKDGNILLDCPAWEQINQQFISDRGGVRWLFLTHRGGMGKKINQMQATLGCQVIVQEQEAYLLPEVEVTSFGQEFHFNSHSYAFWTPGHSPGSSCVYYNLHGGILFTGRHLLPDQQGKPIPLRLPKTFHWLRQLDSVAALRDRFTRETLSYICPGANTGFLRGKGIIEQAYQFIAKSEY